MAFQPGSIHDGWAVRVTFATDTHAYALAYGGAHTWAVLRKPLTGRDSAPVTRIATGARAHARAEFQRRVFLAITSV